MNEGLKLHEAIAQLKEDGSNWAIGRERFDGLRADLCEWKVQIKNQNLIMYVNRMDGLSWVISDNRLNDATKLDWQLHTEPKFKVGDLVKVTKYDRKGMYAEISNVNTEYRDPIYTLAATDETHWGINYYDFNLELVLPAAELAEILNGTETQ